MDPAAFVRQLAPFRELPDDVFRPLGQNIEVVYEPRGAVLLTQGGAPSSRLWIIRKGVVELRSGGESLLDLEAGDWFGFPSLLADAPPALDAIVVEDALLYRIEGRLVRPLLTHPTIAAHLTGGLAARLRAATAQSGSAGPTPLSALLRHPPQTLPAEATAQQAAQLMQRVAVSSVIVEGPRRGIVTDRDLRNRIVAEGRSPDTSLREVMTTPVACLPAEATLEDALDMLLMSARHHVVVTSDGTPDGPLVGVVTTGDLLRRADSPVHVVRVVARAADPGELAGTAERRHRLVAGLERSGASSVAILRATTAVSDAATRAAIRIATEELGDPGVAFAWLALGSQGRREQALLTDQDSALVHAPTDDATAKRLREIAERVVDLLEQAGMPRCRGGTMATTWLGELRWWDRRFRSWIATPDQQALYRASIFFDLRPVAGELDVSPLLQTIRTAGADRVFLARLAAGAGTARPAVGWFHRLRGDRDGRIDLKARGLVPIIDLARLLALEAGESGPGTLARLEAAARANVLSGDGHEILREAFVFLQALRLRVQGAAAQAGEELTNRMDPASLNTLERRHLKEVLTAVADIQALTLSRLGARDVAP